MFGYPRLEREVAQLRGLNTRLAAGCGLEAAPNGLLRGDQKWYGPSFLVGYRYHAREH